MTKTAKIHEILRAEPDTSDAALRERTGASSALVRRARRLLGGGAVRARKPAPAAVQPPGPSADPFLPTIGVPVQAREVDPADSDWSNWCKVIRRGVEGCGFHAPEFHRDGFNTDTIVRVQQLSKGATGWRSTVAMYRAAAADMGRSPSADMRIDLVRER